MKTHINTHTHKVVARKASHCDGKIINSTDLFIYKIYVCNGVYMCTVDMSENMIQAHIKQYTVK